MGRAAGASRPGAQDRHELHPDDGSRSDGRGERVRRRSAADAPVEQLTGDVHVPDVPSRFLNQVVHGPAQRGRTEVARGGQVERRRPVQDGVRLRRLGPVERRRRPRHPSRRATRTCGCASPCPWPRRRRWRAARASRRSRDGPRSPPANWRSVRAASAAGRPSRPWTLKTALSRRCCSHARAIAISSSGVASSGRATLSCGGVSGTGTRARPVATRGPSSRSWPRCRRTPRCTRSDDGHAVRLELGILAQALEGRDQSLFARSVLDVVLDLLHEGQQVLERRSGPWPGQSG